jgi:glycosyltransferase involved in cell wall biosynthesis
MATVTLVRQPRDLPSFRLRLGVLRGALEDAGHDVHVVALPRKPEWLRVWRHARIWRESDAVGFAKLKLLVGESGFIRRRCPRWFLDVDDAIMFARGSRHDQPPDQAGWRQRRFFRMVDSCRLTVTGSNYLAEAIRDGDRRVEVLPTPVDLARYPVATHEEREVLRLAWIGRPGNLGYLRDLHPVLSALKAAGVRFELRVISSSAPALADIDVRLVPWSEESEGRELAACDIGLAPLADDSWTRGKGAYRSIQYAAAGLPTVTSPVGANREVVLDGETGLWATTAEEWLHALACLAGDRVARQRLGAAARQRAVRYDRTVFSARYLGLVRELLAGVGAPPSRR